MAQPRAFQFLGVDQESGASQKGLPRGPKQSLPPLLRCLKTGATFVSEAALLVSFFPSARAENLEAELEPDGEKIIEDPERVGNLYFVQADKKIVGDQVGYDMKVLGVKENLRWEDASLMQFTLMNYSRTSVVVGMMHWALDDPYDDGPKGSKTVIHPKEAATWTFLKDPVGPRAKKTDQYVHRLFFAGDLKDEGDAKLERNPPIGLLETLEPIVTKRFASVKSPWLD